MKLRYLFAVAGALASAPATAAEIVHQDSVSHNGGTLSVSYEARTTTKLRNIGGGPRMPQNCVWKSEVSIERKLADETGRPVAALTRTVSTAKLAEGVHPASCSSIRNTSSARFIGGQDRIRNLAEAAAESDRAALRTELASLGSLGRTAAH